MKHETVPNDYISRYELVKHLTGVEDGWRHPFQYGELQEEIIKFPGSGIAPIVYCNQCKHYEGVHNVQGHAPCMFWNLGGVMWNDFCSRGERAEE